MISIIITPRERYALTRHSVLSVLEGLDKSIEVVFVAGKAPAETVAFLEGIKKKRAKFTVVRVDRYLRANEARLIGLEKIKKGNDVVFIENDVVAKKGWLKSLVRCFRETKADILSPLIMEGDPADPEPQCHIAGVNFIRKGLVKNGPVIGLEHVLNHEKVDKPLTQPRVFDMVEIHCLLIRRKLLDQMVLKPAYSGLFAHFDLCLQAGKKGAKIVVDPGSQVLFVNPAMLPIRNRPDFDFFMFQWGEIESLEQVKEMSRDWGMDPRAKLLWEFQTWVRYNKSLIFTTFGTLSAVEGFLYRASRFRFCPGWVREGLENVLTARIDRETQWEMMGARK